MANQNNNPYLNPVKFHPLTQVQAEQYLSKFMDDYGFRETILSYEEEVCFFQRWGLNDAIRLQFKVNYQPNVLKIFNADGTFVQDHALERRQEDQFFPGTFIYQSDYDTDPLPTGYYQLQMHFGAPVSNLLVSEPQLIQADEDLNDTLYIEYSNYEKKGGLYFQSPFSPCIRIPGRLKYKEPGSIDAWFQDEYLNPSMTQSLSYDVYTLFLGGPEGVPPWLIQKMARIIKCSDVKIDGRYWTVATRDAIWQQEVLQFYPMKGWSIDLRPKLNKDGTEYTTTTAQIGMNSIIGVTDTKGFGFDDAGGDFLEFFDVE